MQSDSARHTLFRCTVFQQQREVLKVAPDNCLTYDTIIAAIAKGREKSKAIQKFAEEVMTVKENTDR